jgi:hypothetical protein
VPFLAFFTQILPFFAESSRSLSQIQALNQKSNPKQAPKNVGEDYYLHASSQSKKPNYNQFPDKKVPTHSYAETTIANLVGCYC